MQEKDLSEIINYAVEPKAKKIYNNKNIDTRDIKRIFSIINQKKELAPFFKYYAGINQYELIGKRKMPLQGFIGFLKEVQNQEYDEQVCSQFFSEVKANNIFKLGTPSIHYQLFTKYQSSRSQNIFHSIVSANGCSQK